MADEIRGRRSEVRRALLFGSHEAGGGEEGSDEAAVLSVPDEHVSVECAAGEALGAAVISGGKDPVFGAGEFANGLLIGEIELPNFVVGRRSQESLTGGSELVGFASEAHVRSEEHTSELQSLRH